MLCIRTHSKKISGTYLFTNGLVLLFVSYCHLLSSIIYDLWEQMLHFLHLFFERFSKAFVVLFLVALIPGYFFTALTVDCLGHRVLQVCACLSLFCTWLSACVFFLICSSIIRFSQPIRHSVESLIITSAILDDLSWLSPFFRLLSALSLLTFSFLSHHSSSTYPSILTSPYLSPPFLFYLPLYAHFTLPFATIPLLLPILFSRHSSSLTTLSS